MTGPRWAPGVGLCASCAHVAVTRSDRGSLFVRCLRSRDDPAFPKYPPLPMTRCDGHRSADEPGDGLVKGRGDA